MKWFRRKKKDKLLPVQVGYYTPEAKPVKSNWRDNGIFRSHLYDDNERQSR